MSYRIERINKELVREITYLLDHSIKDDLVRHAVLTSVDCSRDLKYAKVWFTTIDPDEREAVRAALNAAAGQLRKLMGERMYLRTTPQLEFKIDVSEEYGRHIDKLLDSLSHHDTVRSEDEDDGDNV